jgi:hypothetical protein
MVFIQRTDTLARDTRCMTRASIDSSKSVQVTQIFANLPAFTLCIKYENFQVEAVGPFHGTTMLSRRSGALQCLKNSLCCSLAIFIMYC